MVNTLRKRCRTRGRQGFTLVEVAISTVILLVGAGMLAQTVSALGKIARSNREAALALRAAGNTMESLRGVPLAEAFARFNDTPDDDPDEDSPGASFVVNGLADEGSTATGVVTFPTVNGELREDFVDVALGMPRDLNGDGLTDPQDHAADYTMLPVRVSVSWQGAMGPRTTTITGNLYELE